VVHIPHAVAKVLSLCHQLQLQHDLAYNQQLEFVQFNQVAHLIKIKLMRLILRPQAEWAHNNFVSSTKSTLRGAFFM
jgi:hypothetical protein